MRSICGHHYVIAGWNKWKVIGWSFAVAVILATLTSYIFRATGNTTHLVRYAPQRLSAVTVSGSGGSIRRAVYRGGMTGAWKDTGHAVRQGCNVNGTKHFSFYSQSNEDKALYSRYFSSPPVCAGVFVEIGALDGRRYSNTKFFEDSLHWNGVLIEAQPTNFRALQRNRPRAKLYGEAVCPRGQNTTRFINGLGNAVGGIADQMTDAHRTRWVRPNAKAYTVACRPMADILKDAQVNAVDIFILDVEGAELMVLETLDWKVPVKVFVIEMGRGDRDQQVRELLSKHGYTTPPQWKITDYCEKNHDCANNELFENLHYKYID